MKSCLTKAIGIAALVTLLGGCGVFVRHALTISVTPPGAGIVTVSPSKLSYGHGEEVTLSATPASGYGFHGFEGDAAGLEATAVVVMDRDKSVAAVFTVEGLDIGVSPAGAGEVTVELISGARGYFVGDRLRLTATPAVGWLFSRWEGELSGAANPAELDVSGPFELTALFEPVFEPALRSQLYGGPGGEAYLVETDGRVDLDYVLELGGARRAVYFVFTNTGTAPASYPEVERLEGDFGPSLAVEAARSAAGPATAPPAVLPGNPLADAFYPEATALLTGSPRGRPRARAPLPVHDTAGVSRTTFLYASTRVADQIPATCRAALRSASRGKTLSVWVSDSAWQAGTVTQPMVDVLAERFLRQDGTPRIYEWMTGIFGDEWGPTQYLDLIPDDDAITILLYDVDGDGTGFLTEGGIVGFFWAKDSFTKARLPYSNERVMFYLDAPMLGAAEGGSWEITDPWPQEVVSTLAHEFQHMIHYYQKEVLRGGADLDGTGLWLNEMCSMVAEDLVSDKLGVPGPRGVDPGIEPPGSAGEAGNTEGFLPLYDQHVSTPVAYWPPASSDLDTLLASYASVYAYGAYLARNFGGEALFRAVVQSELLGRAAVDGALARAGFAAESFGTTLRGWTIAGLLSDEPQPRPRLVYNTGGWIPAGSDPAHPYSLGSIDLYNYVFDAGGEMQAGPFISTTFPTSRQPGSSSWHYLAAPGATGTVSWRIRLEQQTRVQVVVKP